MCLKHFLVFLLLLGVALADYPKQSQWKQIPSKPIGSNDKPYKPLLKSPGGNPLIGGYAGKPPSGRKPPHANLPSRADIVPPNNHKLVEKPAYIGEKPPMEQHKPPQPIEKPPMEHEPPRYGDRPIEKPPKGEKPPMEHEPPRYGDRPIEKPPKGEKPPMEKPPMEHEPPRYGDRPIEKPPKGEKPPMEKPPMEHEPPRYGDRPNEKPPKGKKPPMEHESPKPTNKLAPRGEFPAMKPHKIVDKPIPSGKTYLPKPPRKA